MNNRPIRYNIIPLRDKLMEMVKTVHSIAVDNDADVMFRMDFTGCHQATKATEEDGAILDTIVKFLTDNDIDIDKFEYSGRTYSEDRYGIKIGFQYNFHNYSTDKKLSFSAEIGDSLLWAPPT